MTRTVAMVTGSGGFVGRHLIRLLHERDLRVIGLETAVSGIPDVHELSVDIGDGPSVSAAVAEHQPSLIFHLAAIAAPGVATRNPIDAVRVNVEGSLNVFAAAANVSGCTMLYVGTSHQYAPKSGEEAVFSETDALGARDVYGITKEMAERMLLCAASNRPGSLRLSRSFNHTGPGQTATYAVGNFVRQAVEVSAGRRSRIEVGDLSVQRDILDVRDVVRAYIAIATDGKPSTPYNVCRGSAVPLSHILEMALAAAGCPHADVTTTAGTRSSQRVIRGENRRLRQDTGWKPHIPLEQTVHDMVQFQRTRVATGS